jgi:5-(carboxyamino)imidazole ribonucleotide synthase
MIQKAFLAAPVPPGGTVGILGGGQLGRMLALAAAKLGLKAHIYSDEPDAPAFQVAAAHSRASYEDIDALEAFAAACDVVTFEFENVPAATAAALAGRKPIFPSARALATTQDRVDEKYFVAGLGLKTTPFAAVNSLGDAEEALRKIGIPAVLKTRRLGYDGKGQTKIERHDAVATALRAFKGVPAILEGYVDFVFEASVIAARGRDGVFAAYDPPENLHENHILRRSSVPSRMNAEQRVQARTIAREIADALDYVGVLAVELFVRVDGALLVNEIAPRVHNSGHWTIEACIVSQFEQHIRAVAGWPLGDPARHSDAVMENIIGAESADWPSFAASDAALHLYGKTEIRAGRKMGHRTFLKKKKTEY